MADNSLPKTPERDLDLVTYEQVKEIRVVDTSDNSKTLAINNLTIAGTKVTVAVDGLSGTVDGAFGDVLTAIAEKVDKVTDIEQVRSQATNKVPSSKLFDDELVQVRSDLNKRTVDITPITLTQGYGINSLIGDSFENAAYSSCLDYLIYEDVYKDNRIMSKTPNWYILYDENKVYLGRSNNLSSVPVGTVFFRFYFNSLIEVVYYSSFVLKDDADIINEAIASEIATINNKIYNIQPISLTQGYGIYSNTGISFASASHSACLDYLVYADIYNANRSMSVTPNWYIFYDSSKTYLGRAASLADAPTGTVYFRFYYNSVVTTVYYSEFIGKAEYSTEKATLEAEIETKADAVNVYSRSETYTKTESNSNYAPKSSTDTRLSDHDSKIILAENTIESLNSNINTINNALSELTNPLPDGAITGDNVWTGKNTFLQPIAGIAAVEDNEYIRQGEYKQALNRNVDVSDYGANPLSTAAINTAAFNAALSGGNKTVTISKPGIYSLDDTVFIDDNTQLIFSKGVILKKTGTYNYVIMNRGALTRSANNNITIVGLNIDCNSIGITTPNPTSPLHGCKGQLLLYHCNNVIIDDITIKKATVFAIQLCSFYNIVIKNFNIQTLGDGIHVNRGSKLIIKDGIIESYDDAIPLNASDWVRSTPEVGDIHDVIIENVTDVAKATTTGYISRHLLGAWVDWYSGMMVRHGDKVVSNGHVYRVIGSGSTEYQSLNEPNFDATVGAVVDPAGFTWRYNQDDAVYSANVYNVTYRGLSLLESRPMVSCYMETGGEWDRSIYPDVLPANYPYAKGVLIEDVYKPSSGYILHIGNQNIKYDYTIRCVKKFNDTTFVNAPKTDYGLINIDSCNFNAIVNIGLGAIAYINNNNGNPIGGLKNGKVISNNNMAALPAIIKGSRCMYNDEPYYCNGLSWINSAQL